MESPEQANPPASQALPTGTRLEEFEIEKVLGSGGFGITYLARDIRLGRQVVIKENLPAQFAFRHPTSLAVSARHAGGEDAGNFQWSLENFSKEAAMLASLDHPGIVKVLRSFEAFGTAYFVMPFVEGVSLDELSKQRADKAFTEDELKDLLERVLKALSYLHDRGIYHRDIKPGNILITCEDLPVLIDFGSARQRLSERSMTVVESAGYTPFEQLQSRGNVGPWSDLYALGATLAKLLTGGLPPKAMDRMRRDPFEPLAERPDLQRDYSQTLLTSIDKALRVDEDARWQNAQEWLATLTGESLEHQNASAPSNSEPESPEVETPTKPVITAGTKADGVGIVLFFSVLFGAMLLWGLFENNGSQAVKSDGSDSSEKSVPSAVLAPRTLNPPLEVGGLRIISDPTGAQVSNSDGLVLGVTPRTISNLPAGEEASLRLELAGYAPETVSGVPQAGDTLTLPTVTLTPLPQNVRVSSTPSGAEVWEAESRIGTTEKTISNIMPGTRVRYVIKKDGYEDARVEGTVDVNETLELHANLNILPNRPADSQDMDTRAEGWIIVKINDIDYVDMESVKRFYRFTNHHQEGRDFILSNEIRPRIDLRFKIGSDFSSFNDVKFTLFNIVISQDERVLLSRMDLVKIIDPVLRPSFIESGQHFDTVILNPVGDHGNRGAEFTEAEYTLQLAQRTARIMETRGFKVVLTHEIPGGVSLEKRVERANAVAEPAVVLSIGLAHGTQDERGIRTYVSDPLAPMLDNMNDDTYLASICLATAVHGSALTRLGNNTFDNSVSRIHDSFTRQVKHPAILFQGGFFSHPVDARLMSHEPYQKAVAIALADGVVRYRAGVSRAPSRDSNQIPTERMSRPPADADIETLRRNFEYLQNLRLEAPSD